MNIGGINIGSRAGDFLTAAAKDVVRGVAPNLANALDSPLAQVAKNEIARQLTGKADTPTADVEARISTLSAEDAKALRHAQAKVMEVAEQANVDLARIGAEDRADARQAHAGEWAPVALAMLSFAALVAFGVALFVYEPAGAARDILMTIMGALVVMAKQGFDFFLGSSAGSKAKTDMLSRSPR